ncbi:MAG: hypothetical protein SH819_11955 [Cytophagales bacterium]|nr:hypothetical protein [Cytophagales bacterium]
MTEKIRAITKLTLLLAGLLVACSEDEKPTPVFSDFKNPTSISILGYTGGAMEPFVSNDGQYLIFNNPTEGAADANIHYATFVDANTFEYKGLVQGVNTSAFEGAPSMDASGNLYYTSLTSYPSNLLSIYRGVFSQGVVSGASAVDQNLTKNQVGMIDMDAVISEDGAMMVLAIAKFSGKTYPDESNFIIANKINGQFVKDPNSNALLVNINTNLLEYAATLSHDGLELFFNRTDLSGTPFVFHIMVATRKTKAEPFGAPKKVDAIAGEIIEGPTLSANRKDLFYHQKINGVFKIFKVSRTYQ